MWWTVDIVVGGLPAVRKLHDNQANRESRQLKLYDYEHSF